MSRRRSCSAAGRCRRKYDPDPEMIGGLPAAALASVWKRYRRRGMRTAVAALQAERHRASHRARPEHCRLQRTLRHRRFTLRAVIQASVASPMSASLNFAQCSRTTRRRRSTQARSRRAMNRVDVEDRENATPGRYVRRIDQVVSSATSCRPRVPVNEDVRRRCHRWGSVPIKRPAGVTVTAPRTPSRF